MDISLKLYLKKLYELVLEVSNKEGRVFLAQYTALLHNTSKDILSEVPENIAELSKSLFNSFTEQKAERLLELLKPHVEKLSALISVPDEAQKSFIEALSKKLSENGYEYINGAFRKKKKKKLWLIEASLGAELVCDDLGAVPVIRLAPCVKICDTKMKYNYQRELTVCKIPADEICYRELRDMDENAFCKTLLHLEHIDYSIESGMDISESDIEKLVETSLVAPAVCEDKNIPSEYKKLCKNDFPIKKALSISVSAGITAHILILLLLGFGLGFGAYLAGFPIFFGAFLVPPFYILTAIPAIIYAIFVFYKARGGRY